MARLVAIGGVGAGGGGEVGFGVTGDIAVYGPGGNVLGSGVLRQDADGNISIGLATGDAAFAPFQVGDNGDDPLAGGFEMFVSSSGQGLLSQTNDASSWANVAYNSATGNEVDLGGPYGMVVKQGGVEIGYDGTTAPHNGLDVKGGIYLPSAADPSNTTNALYADASGNLRWNGAVIGGASILGTPTYF